MTDAAPPKPPPEPRDARRGRSGLLVRLPLLLAIAFGIWLWKGGGGLVIADRTVIFRMPADRADISRFEFQIYDGDTLLKGIEHRFGSIGAPPDLSTNVPLKEGSYPVKVFAWYSAEPKVTSHMLVVGDSEQLVIEVPGR